MPKRQRRVTTPEKLREVVTNHPNDYEQDGEVLFCKVCEGPATKKFTYQHGPSRAAEHLETLIHKKNKELKTGQPKQTSLRAALAKGGQSGKIENEFHRDLLKAFAEADIPIWKLNHPSLKGLMEKYMKRAVPSRSTLENKFAALYQEVTSDIRQYIGDNKVYFVLDETTDSEGRYVLNILVGSLNGEYSPPALLSTIFLEATNATTVSQAFLKACAKLWPEQIHFDRVLLVTTDQAPYLIKCFRELKGIFPNLRHVSCLIHALHRVCEEIRGHHDVTNLFVSNMKNLFKNSPSRQQKFKEETKLPLPPSAIITRWGSWITSALYYLENENFKKVTTFIDRLDGDNEVTKQLKRLTKDKTLQDELLSLYEYRFLPATIKKLESQGLKLVDQLKIFSVAEEKLKESTFARDKLLASLNKNPDIDVFRDVDKMDLAFRKDTLYAPLTSVDVERSFSLYKTILTDRRHRLSCEKIEQLNGIAFNSFLIP